MVFRFMTSEDYWIPKDGVARFKFFRNVNDLWEKPIQDMQPSQNSLVLANGSFILRTTWDSW